MKETMHSWPTEMPEGRWRYVMGDGTYRPGQFYMHESGEYAFTTDVGRYWPGQFTPGDRFEPIDTREQELERRINKLEAALAVAKEYIKILEERVKLLDWHPSEHGPAPMLENAAISADVMAATKEYMQDGERLTVVKNYDISQQWEGTYIARDNTCRLDDGRAVPLGPIDANGDMWQYRPKSADTIMRDVEAMDRGGRSFRSGKEQ